LHIDLPGDCGTLLPSEIILALQSKAGKCQIDPFLPHPTIPWQNLTIAQTLLSKANLRAMFVPRGLGQAMAGSADLSPLAYAQSVAMAWAWFWRGRLCSLHVLFSSLPRGCEGDECRAK